MKPKLLYLVPQKSYPPIDGGKISIYYPAIYLTKYFDVSYVFPTYETTENIKIAEEHFKKYGLEVFTYRKNIKNDILALLKNFGKDEPFKWDKYYDKNLQVIINSIIQNKNIKYVLVSHPHMTKYALQAKDKFKDLKIIFREHNLEYKLVEQYKIFAKNFIIKSISSWQEKKSKQMEKFYWEKFDKVVFISDYDYNIALSESPNLKNKFSVLYDGYEPVVDEINETNIPKEPNFIYTANLKIIQNKISFEWFINKIWLPNINFIKENNLKLFTTGNTDEAIIKTINKQNLQEINLFNLGYVEDVNKEILKYKYVLSPTIVGSGLRLKILNGLACGKIIFTTPLDLNTCNVFKDMENIVNFESSEDFIQKFLILEKNNDLYIKLSKNSLETIKKYFNWNTYAQELHRIILE